MIQFEEIDIKTGRTLQELNPATDLAQTKHKESEHCYLEHWLKANQVENAQLFVGKFYKGVEGTDRERLEADGKVLVFTNGKDGYFADPQTAHLMTAGDVERGINPIYAADQNSAHNVVAYGSLIASDGMASAEIKAARILVIDDEQRTHGTEPLQDRQGTPIPAKELEKLYDKLGDGTMLIPQQTMAALITTQERDAIAQQVFQKAGISSNLTNLAEDYPAVDQAMEQVERQTNALIRQTVTQFRAATPDLPGILKGTMATSAWCERLGVDAIISKNDIKGDDGRLSAPGIKEVESFWLNRKSDGSYGEQVVGPQVKGCIPEATLHEFNPRMKAQAEELAEIASNPQLLLKHYAQQKDRQREQLDSESDLDSDEVQLEKADWLYDLAKADEYGVLTGFSKMNRELDRFVRGERLDNATGGIYVPSAMAQHHSALEPWEVCNKDLPHGAILAYYRSPFPNVGAAAIAVNNTEVLKQEDSEAFKKEGVAYLNPWTAKNIAITDFDKDANGYFVGYVATVPDLPEQAREQLAETKALPQAEQYEAGRALFGQLIEQAKQGDEGRIKPGDYPLAVEEFIERNAPDQRPPEIIKQKKIKHPWEEGESHSAATWKAWSITADNPTGMVANAGMTLQSLALETQYAPESQKEGLLRHISSHYSQLLNRVEKGSLHIPTNAELTEKGFPAYSFQERITDLSHVNRQLRELRDPQQRREFVEEKLDQVHRLLSDFVDGPNAENLQTAVDTAKSSRGIDQDIQNFGKALAHKKHELRQNQKDPSIYLNGKEMPTNTQEPIGWAVEESNRIYQNTQLPELKNEAFRDLIPKNYTPEQEEAALNIARTYNRMVKSASEASDRLREKNPEDTQPTLTVTTPASGSQFTIQRLCDVETQDTPIWRTDGSQQADWTIAIERNLKQSQRNPEAFVAQLTYPGADGTPTTTTIGFIAPESAERHPIAEQLQAKGRLTIEAPLVEIRPPLLVESHKDEQFKQARTYLSEAVSQIPAEEKQAYVSALWRHSEGMGVALKAFPGEVAQQLSTVPEIKLTGIQRDTNEAGQVPDGIYQARFSEYHYTKADGEVRTSPSVALLVDGEEKQFGAIDPRSMRCPIGTLVEADIHTDESGKVARMQVRNLVSEAEPEPEPEQLVHDLPAFEVLEGGLSHRKVAEASNDWRSDSAAEILNTTAAQSLHNEPLKIVTDGACKGNPGPGGWGAILMQGDTYREIGGNAPETTNNRMEMTAGIEALKYAKAEGLIGDSTPVKIVSDSQLLINGATGEWKRSANKDLWAEYDEASKDVPLSFEWVRGHNGHELNERVDAIAQAFATGQQPDLRQHTPTSDLNESREASIPMTVKTSTDLPEPRVEATEATFQVSQIEKYPTYLSNLEGQIQAHSTWDECKDQVQGVSGALYKKVTSEAQAVEQLKKWGVEIESEKVNALPESSTPTHHSTEVYLASNDRTVTLEYPDTLEHPTVTIQEGVDPTQPPTILEGTPERLERLTSAIEREMALSKSPIFLTEKEVEGNSRYCLSPEKNPGENAIALSPDQIHAIVVDGKPLEQVYEASAQILVGDASGTDKLVQNYVLEKGYDLSLSGNGFCHLTPPKSLEPLDIAQQAKPETVEGDSFQPAGKPVKMVFPLKLHGEENPLPVDTCIDAMRGHGRCHTTRNFEPHAAYNFKEGDVAIAVSGDKQVAFRVGEQYRITPEMINDPAYQKQWAEMEKHSPQELQSFQGKTAWGMKMEPLGDVVNGKIVAFPSTESDRVQSDTHSPSRGELLSWLQAIKDKNPEQAEKIRELGRSLKSLYNQEQGSPDSSLTPPKEYRHPDVQLSEKEHQQMTKDTKKIAQVEC